MDSTGERESIFSHWFVVAIDTTTIYWDKTDKVREWDRKRKENTRKKNEKKVLTNQQQQKSIIITIITLF